MSASGPKTQITNSEDHSDRRTFVDSRQFVDNRQDNRVHAPTTNTSLQFNPSITLQVDNSQQDTRCQHFNDAKAPNLGGSGAKPGNGTGSGTGMFDIDTKKMPGASLQDGFDAAQRLMQQMLQGFMAQIQSTIGSQPPLMDPKSFFNGPSVLNGPSILSGAGEKPSWDRPFCGGGAFPPGSMMRV